MTQQEAIELFTKKFTDYQGKALTAISITTGGYDIMYMGRKIGLVSFDGKNAYLI